MKFTEILFERVKHIWDGYLEHPFIVELGEGTLEKDKFKNYLIQDYLYLVEYSKVFALGIVKSESVEEMKFYLQALRGTVEDETAVHIEYLEGFGYSREKTEKCDALIENSSYTSYMQSIALKGNMKEIAMAVMPCTWGYYYIGSNLKEKYNDKIQTNFYKSWIEEYSSENFKNTTEKWINYIDEICKNIQEDEKEELIKIFINSSVYEMEFWNMAYK